MDQTEFDKLMQQAAQVGGTTPQQQEGEQPALEVDPEALQGLAQQFMSGVQSPEAQPEETTEASPLDENGVYQGGPSISDLPGGEVIGAFAGGVAKSVFETKDFLFGDTPPEDQSRLRRAIEQDVQAKTEDSIINGFSAGIGQFAGAMLGIGKAQAVAKNLPWVGAKVGAALGWSRGLTETLNAATAGAIAFDPHEERLSNLVQGTPLANPVTAWLAADPDDSAAEGRLKSALESIGLDAVLAGTFMGAAKIYKALRKGDTSGAASAADELEAAQRADMEAERAAPQDIQQPAVVGDETPPALEADVQAVPEGEGVSGVRAGPAEGSLAGEGRADSTPGSSAADTQAKAGEEAVPVQVVDNPTQAASHLGEELLARGTPRVRLSVEDTGEILAQADADREAITKYGGWYQAAEAGHQFGKGEGINYRALNSDADMDDLMARMVDAVDEQRSKIKGGKVLTDEAANKRLRDYAVAFGEDPVAVLGAVQQAGKMGADLTARMEAGYILAERVLRDTWRLHQLYKLGDFTQYGGPVAMRQEIAKRMSISASLFAHADSLKSNYARGMRRMAFFNDYSKLKDMDMDKAFDLLDATGGNPAKFKKLANPSIWSNIGDYALYLRVNAMVSGPITQLINVSTNGYMLGVRPLERILGSVVPSAMGNPESRKVLREAVAQYAYMGNSFVDGFFQAGKAFMRNDSVLAPHRTELYGSAQAVSTSGIPGTQPLNSEFFRKWDKTPNVLYNALSAATVPIGLPTRLLGTVDELVKQVTYRSKLMARAHVEAVGMATDAGLTGKAAKDFVKAHVQRRVDEGFDAAGRGTDPGALHEAQIATFQQDLLPNTVGKWVQNGTSNIKALRLVLPFVKTPTNVIRYGWKMTPGLNLLQGEYRDMLTGRMGKEMQSQAIGQMSMGSLFIGATAYMAANGMITGGGPKDPKLKQELMATGWKPYSFVWENDDGTKNYVTFGRFDPIAIPMGIVADIQDTIHALERADETPEVEAAIGALTIALAKQFTSKSYLLGATQTMEFLMDPETKWGAVGGNMASSFIPYSAAMRQLNPDDYLREARTVTDKLMSTIPGLSDSVPARYDAFGEPILSRNGLWSSSDDALLDGEMQRLAVESGSGPVRVSPNMDGVDLREITLENGKNAYEEYQRLSGRPTPRTKPLKQVITKFIQTEAYKRAPDGDRDQRGTKLWLLYKYTSKYREAAAKIIKRDPKVREVLMRETVKVRDHYKALRTGQPVSEPRSFIDKLTGAFGIGN